MKVHSPHIHIGVKNFFSGNRFPYLLFSNAPRITLMTHALDKPTIETDHAASMRPLDRQVPALIDPIPICYLVAGAYIVS